MVAQYYGVCFYSISGYYIYEEHGKALLLTNISTRFSTYSLPSIKIDIKTQELALRRGAPQRLIFHWEGSMQSINLKKILFKREILSLLRGLVAKLTFSIAIQDREGKILVADLGKEVTATSPNR